MVRSSHAASLSYWERLEWCGMVPRESDKYDGRTDVMATAGKHRQTGLWADALSRARAHSGFLGRMAARHDEAARLLEKGNLAEAWNAANRAGDGASGTMQALRRRRGAIALVTAVADLAGAWDFEQVTGRLSDFADEAVEAALSAAFAERYPDDEPRGFAVIALGKHGS